MPLTVPELTTTATNGTGVFDVLMRSVKAHLEQEFVQGRIKGPEYSEVYLASLNLAMQTGMTFLLQKDKADLEAQLLTAQVTLANVEVQKAQAELAILQAQEQKIPAEIAQIEAQTDLLIQQTANGVIEGANLTKTGLVLTEQRAHLIQQTTNLAAEASNIPKQGDLLVAQADKVIADTALTTSQTALVDQNVSNAMIEGSNLTKTGEMLSAQKAHVLQTTTNLAAEALNIPKQGAVLDDQDCLLKAQYNLTVSQTAKSASEIDLLTQKIATEKGQTQAVGVDDNSVIGKQKLLYAAQTKGFARDAEQKAAKLLADTWSVRRTTDETGTSGNTTNKLDDATVGTVINKMITGLDA